jgi:NAD(P)-dependent dehydrogenase (short-subunit alcohol dehydrogenase family)
MQLKEVNAIVTGGASGLGLAVASRIVRGGGKAAILDLSIAAGNAAAAGSAQPSFPSMSAMRRRWTLP